MSAATSGGTPSGIGTTARRRARPGPSAIVPIEQVGEDRRAVGARRGASCRRPARGAATASRSTATGGRAGTRGSGGRARTTRARPPARRRPGRVPAPTASMTPAPSWPRTIGPGRSQSPSRTWRSEWQTPDAVIRTRTSPGRGSSSRSVSIGGGAPARSMTAASISRTRPRPRSRPSSAGVLEPGRDAVDRRPDDAPDAGRASAGARSRRPEPAEQLDLDGRQGVDVRVPELDRAGERRRARRAAGRRPVTRSSRRTDRANSASIVARIAARVGARRQVRVAAERPEVRLGERQLRVVEHGREERPAPVQVRELLERRPTARARRPPRAPCRGRTSRAGSRATATRRTPTGSRAASAMSGALVRRRQRRARPRGRPRPDPSPRPGDRGRSASRPRRTRRSPAVPPASGRPRVEMAVSSVIVAPPAAAAAVDAPRRAPASTRGARPT